jgi:hypothetical protein
MNFVSRPKPAPKTKSSSQREMQAAAFDAVCQARPLRPPTSTRPELRVVRKPLPNNPTL